MVRLPSKFDLSGPETLRSGRMISAPDETAIGRGLASLGGGIAAAGAGVRAAIEGERKRQATVDLARANAYQDKANIDLLNEFDRDPDYATFGKRGPQKATEIVETAAGMIRDPEMRELWKLQATSAAARTGDAVADKGFMLSKQADVVSFDEALETERRIYIDPNSSEEAKEKARASIEGAIEVGLGSGLLTPEGAEARRQAYLHGADFERAKLDTTLTDPRSTYFAAIRAAESGGNDSAVNPNSSAAGRYQFIQSTWDRLVERYPNAGLTKDGRLDPAQQERAIRLFTAENEQALASAGLAGTNTNLYAAHFLGAGAAVPVLNAPNGAALEGLVPSEVIKANPFLKGMTVGEFKAWAAEKSGGGAELPAYIERLPADQRQVVFDMRAAEAAQAATAAQAAATAAYKQHQDAWELGIATDERVSETELLSDPYLNDGDKATLLGKMRTRQNEAADARLILEAFSSGAAGPVNPYDADQKKVVNDAYDLLMKSTPPEQRAAVTASYVETFGVVPDPVVASVRQNLNSSDPASIASGLQQSAALVDAVPMGLDAVEHGKEITEAATVYDELVNGRGLSVEDAAKEVLRLRDPAQQKADAVLESSWNLAVKDKAFVIGDVLKAFEQPFQFMGSQPVAGVTPAQEAGLLADYLDAAERAFKGKANGDVGMAKALALTEIKSLYGVSESSGRKALMKYPPELFFPPMNGGHGYVRDLALMDAKTLYPETSNVMLIPTTQTAQDVRAGVQPRYNLLYLNEQGIWDMAPDLFTVGGDSQSALSALDSEERQIQFEMTRAGANFEREHPEFMFSPDVKAPEVPALQERLNDVRRRRDELLGRPKVETTDPQEEERRYFENVGSSFGGMGGLGANP